MLINQVVTSSFFSFFFLQLDKKFQFVLVYRSDLDFRPSINFSHRFNIELMFLSIVMMLRPCLGVLSGIMDSELATCFLTWNEYWGLKRIYFVTWIFFFFWFRLCSQTDAKARAPVSQFALFNRGSDDYSVDNFVIDLFRNCRKWLFLLPLDQGDILKCFCP